jgi:hypothetical protein
MYFPVLFEICQVRNSEKNDKDVNSCFPNITLSQLAMSYRRFDTIVMPLSLCSEAFVLLNIDRAKHRHFPDNLDRQVEV